MTSREASRKAMERFKQSTGEKRVKKKMRKKSKVPAGRGKGKTEIFWVSNKKTRLKDGNTVALVRRRC